MRKKMTYLGGLTLGALCVLGLKGCGGDEARSTTSGYQGLGSKWTASFDSSASTFAITYDSDSDGTAEMEVNGTYVEHDNKFRTLTVTSASGTGAPNVNATALGLEIPGFAFFLKPLEAGSEPIVMVASGTCPTDDFISNWIIAKYQEPDSTPTANTDAWGTATFDLSAATASIAQYKFGDGASLGSGGINLDSCTDGTYTFSEESGSGTMYATANGGMLVNPGSGIIFAAPQLASDPTSTNWNGTYSGLVFASDETFPAKITLSGAGGTGDQITNVANDTLDTGGVTFASLSAQSGLKGIITGTVDLGEGAQPLNCVYSSVEDDELLACNGANGAAVGGVYPLFFFLGVKR